MSDPTPAPPSSPPGEDWPAQATDTLVSLVDSVREKTSGPATSVVRAVVFGLLAGILGLATLILVFILLVRGIDVSIDWLLDALDIHRDGRSTWITHGLLGLILVVVGSALWRRGRRAIGG